ncbi:hypothetical protein HYH02_009345 [Chlamydomonas schloesseri]|uniref:Uncharacterized protein n=1 Tax=Chlamydomonas schloesseri TaxID=2026947 RepID=A0A835W895_9CHLO|nr:hypothetical protein HYH02_009345 [Chlamydomonas schloesseri]|eukprot:KAG2443275.1 hypothetical protein HYH02_009345 [Chlamydomonas schloesseri]
MSVRSDGAAVYVVDDEAIAAKTAFLKKAATAAGAVLRPRLVARNALVRPAPHVLPQRVFAGEPLHVLMEVVSAEPDASVELTAEWADPAAAGGAAPLTLCLPLGPALASSAEEGEALPVLHAMAYIGSLMAGTSPLHVRPDGTPLAAPPSADTVKEAVVRLAVAEHLVTPHTSAVGVSLCRDPAAPEAGANVAEVPLQLPHGWPHSWRAVAKASLALAMGLAESELLMAGAGAVAGGGDAGRGASASAAALALRSAGLTDDAWATVVLLAVLRRCLAAQREVWADLTD